MDIIKNTKPTIKLTISLTDLVFADLAAIIIAIVNSNSVNYYSIDFTDPYYSPVEITHDPIGIVDEDQGIFQIVFDTTVNDIFANTVSKISAKIITSANASDELILDEPLYIKPSLQ